MEILRRLNSVISHHNSESLSQLFNTVETQCKRFTGTGGYPWILWKFIVIHFDVKTASRFSPCHHKRIRKWRLAAAAATTGTKVQTSPPKLNRKGSGTAHAFLSGSGTSNPTCTYCRGTAAQQVMFLFERNVWRNLQDVLCASVWTISDGPVHPYLMVIIMVVGTMSASVKLQ